MKKLSEIKIKPNNASQVHSHAHKINGHLVPVPRRTCALQGHCISKRNCDRDFKDLARGHCYQLNFKVPQEVPLSQGRGTGRAHTQHSGSVTELTPFDGWALDILSSHGCQI